MTTSSRLRAAGLAALAALALVGCDLRLETPPPTVPEAGPTEVIRDRAARDAADLAAGAVGSVTETEGTALARVAEESAAHLVALGGVYVPFPDGPPGGEAGVDADATPAPTATPPQTAAEVLGRLVDAGATARADADATEDGPLARLLASVATARILGAEDLSRARGVDAGHPPLLLPDAAPAGTPGSVLEAIVATQDGLAYAWEVHATRTGDADAAERGALLRTRATGWARATGLAESGVDPRRVAYELPAELTRVTEDREADHAAARTSLADLERHLAAVFAAAVAETDPGHRGPLLDGLVDSARTVAALTGTAGPFPGLPEQSVSG